MRKGSAEGRHCGWGTSLWGKEWGLGCREGGLHSTEWGALCMGYPLKCILQNRGEKGRRVRHTFCLFVVIKPAKVFFYFKSLRAETEQRLLPQLFLLHSTSQQLQREILTSAVKC